MPKKPRKKLTESRLAKLKPPVRWLGETQLKVYDGGSSNLVILVLPSGRKTWRFRYSRTVNGKPKEIQITLGQWSPGASDHVSLAAARAKAATLTAELAAGGTPAPESVQTFKEVADAWVAKESPRWSASTKVTKARCLKYCTALHSQRIAAIRPNQCADLLDDLEKLDKLEQANKVRIFLRGVFAYALGRGLVERNFIAELPKIRTRKAEHHAGIVDESRLGALLRAIRGYAGARPVRVALEVLANLACRPGELRLSRWSDVDLNRRTLTIAAERVKTRRAHVIPLSDQTLALFTEYQAHVPHGPDAYVFASTTHTGRPISENTLNSALRALGFGDEHKSHGFRTSFKTILTERRESRDIVEACAGRVGHIGKSERAYDRSELSKLRADLMQKWSDLLDAFAAKTA